MLDVENVVNLRHPYCWHHHWELQCFCVVIFGLQVAFNIASCNVESNNHTASTLLVSMNTHPF